MGLIDNQILKLVKKKNRLTQLKLKIQALQIEAALLESQIVTDSRSVANILEIHNKTIELTLGNDTITFKGAKKNLLITTGKDEDTIKKLWD